MSNTTNLCAAPFLPLSVANGKGAIDSRNCLAGCCIPCPLVKYTYKNSFMEYMKIVNAFNVVVIACLCLLLISYLLLPKKYTRRTWLSVSYTMFAILLTIVPTFINLTEDWSSVVCADPITPNNSGLCQISGITSLLGVHGIGTTTLARLLMLSVEVQIGRTLQPIYGKLALCVAWIIPIAFCIAAIVTKSIHYATFNYCLFGPYEVAQFALIPLIVYSIPILICEIFLVAKTISLFTYLPWLSFTDHKVHIRSRSRSHESAPTDDKDEIRVVVSGDNKAPQVVERSGLVKLLIKHQWRTILFATNFLWIGASFGLVGLKMKSIAIRTLSNPTSTLLWVACILENDGNYEACAPAYWQTGPVTAGYAFILPTIAGIAMLVISFQAEVLKGWKDVFTGKSGLFVTKKQIILDEEAQRRKELLRTTKQVSSTRLVSMKNGNTVLY